MERIPMCNKCANAITEESGDPSNSDVLIGCQASEHIHNYFDAKGNCPLIKTEKQFDVTEFIEKTRKMCTLDALDAIFLAVKEQKISLTVFRTLMLRYIYPPR